MSRLGRLADVAANPPKRVEAHRLRAHWRCEVILDALQLGDADSLRPLITEFVKNRLALAEHLEAELGHPKALAAGVARVRVAGDVTALLQDHCGLRGRLLS